MGVGSAGMEIFKEVGLPKDVAGALGSGRWRAAMVHRPHPDGDGIGGHHDGRASA